MSLFANPFSKSGAASGELPPHLLCRSLAFYCAVSWEFYLSASTREEAIAYAGEHGCTERQRQLLELYQESPTSLVEGMAALSQLLLACQKPEEVKRCRDLLTDMLPEEKRAARAHPLMQMLNDAASPKGAAKLGNRRHRPVSAAEANPVDRENTFIEFLAIPGFEAAFQHYWHLPPRDRDNVHTRALILVAAIWALVSPAEADDSTLPAERIARHMSCSSVTAEDVCDIARSLSPDELDATQIAVHAQLSVSEADLEGLRQIVTQALEDEDLPSSCRAHASAIEACWRLSGPGT